MPQIKPGALEPTKFELFAKRSSAKVKWSKKIGTIDEGDSHALITALDVEDSAQSPYTMRGIRIDLSNQTTKDEIYLDESHLEGVKNALLEIESGVDAFRKEPSPTPIRYWGAAEFWRPYERIHTLNAAYFIRPESSGLSLSAHKAEEFRFPNHRPRELADLFIRAIQALKHQP